MFCQVKKCHQKKGALSAMSEWALLVGGLSAAAYFGYRLFEKLSCRCGDRGGAKVSRDGGCLCHMDGEVTHEYDHVSENDCLCHDKKDYYGKCGCFDAEDGNPPVSDDKASEEML